MQIQFDLKPMFSYSLIPIFLVIIGIVLIIILKIISNNKKESIKSEIIVPKEKDLLNIKNKYLRDIQKLSNNLSNGIITNRNAYQQLSTIIRNFIYEATNIKVQYYTLNDIKSINMPILYELVSEYYNPEFAKISKGNIPNSIERTRMVIERWN